MDVSIKTSLSEWLDDLLSEPIDSAAHRARIAFDSEVRDFGNRFVLHGAGNMGRQVLNRLRQDGIEPLAFADNEKARWTKSVDGLEVLAPDEAAARYGKNAVFIVTVYNNTHSFPDTRSQLSRLGCIKVLSVIPLRWKYHERFLPYYHDDLPQRVLLQRNAIRAAYDLWSDDLSRREFVAQIAWRLRGDFDVLGEPSPQDEYFPKGFIRFRADEIFVDVGAYDGDTIRRFLENYGQAFHRIIALEPDAENHEKLVRYVSEMPVELAQRISHYQLAASNYTGRLRFSGGNGLAAALDERGSIEVESIGLDSLLKGQHPTYIKMDIEGAELDAIEGCRQVISENHPVLATCVYHTQDHLWRVPLVIRDIYAQYQFFLRSHMKECWDTVCYAVPPDRNLASKVMLPSV